MNSASVATEESHVTKQLGLMDEALIQLADGVTVLEQKLKRVLINAPDTKDPSTAPPGGLVPLAMAMQEDAENVRKVTQHVHQIIQRLQV